MCCFHSWARDQTPAEWAAATSDPPNIGVSDSDVQMAQCTKRPRQQPKQRQRLNGGSGLWHLMARTAPVWHQRCVCSCPRPHLGWSKACAWQQHTTLMPPTAPRATWCQRTQDEPDKRLGGARRRGACHLQCQAAASCASRRRQGRRTGGACHGLQFSLHPQRRHVVRRARQMSLRPRFMGRYLL